jgi:hypothetical protein
MNLKKNDKIILIIGVVILIIAGAGIALYTTDETSAKAVDEIEDSYEYSYTWTPKDGNMDLDIDAFVGKKSVYEEVYDVASNSGTVLTSVNIKLIWEDDVTYGILFEKGLDTLSAEVIYKGKSEEKKSEGNGTLKFLNTINTPPKADTIIAEDYDEAENIIRGNIENMNKASFNVKVTINTGERIWRLLKFFRDKGNNFDLTAEYTYYIYSLEEVEDDYDDDDDFVDTGLGFNHKVGEFYVQLGYGRGMI